MKTNVILCRQLLVPIYPTHPSSGNFSQLVLLGLTPLSQAPSKTHLKACYNMLRLPQAMLPTEIRQYRMLDKS